MKYTIFKLAAIVVISAGISSSCADNPVTNYQMQQVENKVAEDAVKQYDIAKRNGNAIDAFAAAGMVKAAYLQANDEANYKKWVEIEKQEAKAAGIEMPN